MPKSPTKRRPATVAALTDSALTLFAERGFHATSISDIVQQAGLTRGAFYSNFRDKEELFLALYDAHTDRLLAELRRQVESFTHDADPVARVFDLLATHDAQERSWFLVSMEFTLHAARHPDVARALAEHEERLNAGLAEILDRCLTSSGHAADVSSAALARLVVALYEGLTAMRVTHPTADTDPTPLARRALPHLVRALGTPQT
ncbi:TetR/AcrR family transcriptional regulator [Streptomyces sp. NPDC007100]|uniref:TetR/AcrR family transcriptional regulator n=1 Tax=Streptomyces sp. NPDC007100 TaxID=3155602 RepID=UPI0033DF39C0